MANKTPTLSPALQAAHAARAANKARKAALTPAEVAKEGVSSRVRKAAQALTVGHGNLARFFKQNRADLTPEAMLKAVEYLEQQVSMLRAIAEGQSEGVETFSL